MKRGIVLFGLLISAGIWQIIPGQSPSVDNSINQEEIMPAGEQIFIEYAGICLAAMAKEAERMSVEGVAVISFIPGDETRSWISRMRVVGSLSDDNANLLAIAYAKTSEMADTYKNSGSSTREPKTGEFGWQGGVIKKVGEGFILAAFSGASGEQDVEISRKGLDCLSGKYEPLP